MTWKGIITQISDVGADGNIMMYFDVQDDFGVAKYSNLRVSGKPGDVIPASMRMIADLREQQREQKKLTVGQVFEVA